MTMKIDQLFDMEMKPTLQLITKSVKLQQTPQLHGMHTTRCHESCATDRFPLDVFMDIMDEEFDEEEMDLSDDDFSSLGTFDCACNNRLDAEP